MLGGKEPGLPFLRGQVSFCRLGIAAGPGITTDQGTLDVLGEHTISPGPRVGAPAEVEAGWCAGRHLYDERFTYDKNVLMDGAIWHAGLRLDTNRVPGEVKRAIKAQHEDAAVTAPGGFLSRGQKREVKDLVERALHDELASGKHRKSALVDVLADTDRGVLLSAAAGNGVIEKLCALYRETFGDSLTPHSAGAIASELLGDMGRRRELEDALPTAFTEAPSGADGTPPEVSWARGSNEPADFLGNEFLIWLWFRTDQGEGMFTADLGKGAKAEVAVALDRTVEMECAWAITGKQTLKGDADGLSPFRLPEAWDALGTGKWPRRVGMLLAEGAEQWMFSFQGDRWLISGCALPSTEEKFETVREANEFRVSQVRRLDELLIGVYRSFLSLRTGPKWAEERQAIRAWIAGRRPERRGRPVSGAASGSSPRPAVEVPAPERGVLEGASGGSEAGSAPFAANV